MQKKNRKGFTLAELLIVVAIIAVLVAVSIPIFSNQLKKARLATNQANARAAFSAAEAAYLDYMAVNGSVEANCSSNVNGKTVKTLTYTYFPAAGKGILKFCYPNNTNGWKLDPSGKFSVDTNIAEWQVDSKLVSDGYKLGDAVPRVWTIHMDPSNGQIVGFYCAYPKSNDPTYKSVLQAFANGTESQFEQK
jgi:prepilin-type N-terminal cleavage/methylation domain-containing protein